ncbi:HD domain-containing protein [Desulfovibrio sp. OttesenSCG-928-F20]|nr:HD domain-containing protein [Desulfovibrio sp. OttesenSCG-928-F20]
MTDIAPAQPLEKNLFVADLSLGQEAADIFILSAAQQGQSRNGPYWRLEFRDASGSIAGKMWSPQSLAHPDLSSGLAVWVKGRVTSYRDKLELAIDALRVLDETERAALDLALFMPASARNPDAMLEELRALTRQTLTHKPWRKLVLSLLEDDEICSLLRLAPAAKSMHHAYAGGLLEHTLSVAGLCLHLADHYPQLDRQALFAGAVCHDLGKIWELSQGLSTDYTSSGRLIGHINLLLDRLKPFIKKSGLEPELAEHLEHLVLSHHGSHEFGSPRLPASAEAFALHYADNIDAKLQQVAGALDGMDQGGWSAYVPSLERFLYNAPKTPEPPRRPATIAGKRNSVDHLPLFQPPVGNGGQQ